jgi:hypothetical protein
MRGWIFAQLSGRLQEEAFVDSQSSHCRATRTGFASTTVAIERSKVL